MILSLLFSMTMAQAQMPQMPTVDTAKLQQQASDAQSKAQTQAGNAQAQAAGVQAQADAAKAAMTALQNGCKGDLEKTGCSTQKGKAMVACLKTFHKTHPDVKLSDDCNAALKAAH
jgi:cbb3-type cytochrome oxidase cytochrome c subunit